MPSTFHYEMVSHRLLYPRFFAPHSSFIFAWLSFRPHTNGPTRSAPTQIHSKAGRVTNTVYLAADVLVYSLVIIVIELLARYIRGPKLNTSYEIA